ncbi:phosphotransferase [Aquincola sp. S2]|uniref:Phosphotransferase n=1 Tax=Pseudaquabacterium terrae TaxID=2732868 RepID=A0ABX2EI61_9BURK|nr:phosphotransferase [Aquabacterium terrae]NRF68274.1 phosphotransferase [Aquabacterium terrae]
MSLTLPASIDVAGFDALHDDVARWRGLIASIGAGYSASPVEAAGAGTVLVGLVGQDLVVKLYPPFLRDHFEFEAAVLERLQGRLSVPTPQLVDRSEHDGWPFLVMTQLAGEPLDAAWPSLSEAARCRVLESIGRVAAEVHALAPDGLAALAPAWDHFVQRQRAGCLRRQQRTGLPAHLLAQLEPFVDGALPEGPPVILTGEYTPMNLLLQRRETRLAGMFDFGDGLLGPARYDWLGPLCFLAAGQRERCDAFLAGYGAPAGRDWRLPLLRLLLLHRYSNLPGQIAQPGWQAAPSFEALAELIWP